MSRQIDSSAETGFEKAMLYDQNRPSYPAEAIEALKRALSGRSDQSFCMVDLAAGTGKFTESIVSRLEFREVIAVEPHPQMRKLLNDKALARVKVVDGTATDMKAVPNQWADAVVIAQV